MVPLDGLALQVMLLRKQIDDTRYTARSLIGIMGSLPVGTAAHAWNKAALKTLIMGADCMVEALEELEKDL